MKLIAVASVFLFAGVAVCEEPTVQLNDFQSKAAKLAVKTFNERLSFLEQSMQQHVDTANAKLREELKAALEQAAKQEDLKETERISRFLQADAPPKPDHESAAARETIQKLRTEVSELKKRLDQMTQPDPLVGTWKYQSGNVCYFTNDGWVVLKGERIAAWKRTGENSYVTAFLKNFGDGSSDEMTLGPDGKTIMAKSKSGKGFSMYRIPSK
ncbi:MAG: hypothetical protein CMM00_01200 [Rhodopirellula sp.]|nr:hypothetical protein [Rhodopirellula sp.]